LFVLLYFFFWPLCCLFFFDIRILIVPLVSSNSSEDFEIIWLCSILTLNVLDEGFSRIYVFIQREKLYILPTVLIEDTIVHNKQYIITNFIILSYDVQENFIDIKRQAEIFSLFAHVIHFRIFDRIS